MGWKEIKEILDTRQALTTNYYLNVNPVVWAKRVGLDQRRARNKNAICFISGDGEYTGIRILNERSPSALISLIEPISLNEMQTLKEERSETNLLLLMLSSNDLVRFIVSEENSNSSSSDFEVLSQ